MATLARKSLPGAAALLLLVLVAYIPAMRGGFVWDDDDYVTQNHSLTSLEGLGNIWTDVHATPQYYPLVFTSFWLEYHLWGASPLGYHIVNVLLHALSGLLLWALLRRLGVPGAWFGAAVFALHPVHVESVAWIAERKNVLSGVFYLAALLTYFRFARLDLARVTERRGWSCYALAVFLFACALLSKTVTASLPAAILLLLWWKRERIGRRDILPLIPLFALGMAMGLTTAWIEKHQVGAEGSEFTFSFVDRCLIAGRALWFYAAKLIWPLDLAFIYPRWSIDSSLWWQYLYPIAGLAVVGCLWSLRKRIGKGPLAAVLFFGGTLVPALGFVNVYPMRFSFVADHFQYLASIGLIALFTAMMVRGWKGAARNADGRIITGSRGLRAQIACVVIQAAILGILSTLVWRQGGLYRDGRTLWFDTLAKNPAAWMAHNNLGTFFERQGQLDEAMAQYAAALSLKPDFPEGHYNLGQALAGRGKLDEAIAHYGEALRSEPAYAKAHNGLAVALAAQGRFDEAITHYMAALRFRPAFAQAHNNLGAALASQGRLDEAIGHFAEALRLDPAYAEAHNNLAGALARAGRLDEAFAHLGEALRLKPDYAQAHCNLADALASRGRLDEAVEHYTAALRLNPAYAEAHNNLANALSMQGRLDEAVTQYVQALRANPNLLEAQYNLADTLAGQGKFDEAAQHFREAVRINPAFTTAHTALGGALERGGKTNEAIQEYQEALRLNPGDTRLRDHLDGILSAGAPPKSR